MPDVAILGCGPAGLLAAYAVQQQGGSPVIFSNKLKSTLPGAQYLHESIPGLTAEPDGVIRTRKLGTREGYAEKVYGHPDAPVSWDETAPERPAWDLRRVYDVLWENYADGIVELTFPTGGRHELASIVNMFELTIATLPMPYLCIAHSQGMSGAHFPCSFEWQKAHIVHESPLPEDEDNIVEYNGDLRTVHYRTARIFGRASTEFPTWGEGELIGYATKPKPRGTKLVFPETAIKVVQGRCACWPALRRAGRFGTWRKGYLTHHAFKDAVNHYKMRFGT